MITADGFETAFVAVAFRYNGNDIAVYDYDLCIDVLIDRDTMSVEEAHEFMSYNVIGAYVGEQTPLFIRTKTYEEMLDEYSDSTTLDVTQ
jgi:fucose permease